MSSTLSDQQRAPAEPISGKPRGLLPVPPAVVEHVELEAARAEQKLGHRLPVATKQQMLNQATLDWYYQDQWVSYRDTAQGVEVLAVGLDEIGKLAATLAEDQRSEVKTKLV